MYINAEPTRTLVRVFVGGAIRVWVLSYEVRGFLVLSESLKRAARLLALGMSEEGTSVPFLVMGSTPGRDGSNEPIHQLRR
jgi:hypothetical protein